MIVRAAGHQPQAARLKFIGERHGVGAYLPLVLCELRRHRFAECHRLRRDDMLKRPALHIGKHRAVHRAPMRFVAQNHPAARAAQSLVRGGGYNLGKRHRRGMFVRRNKPRDVRHIHHQLCAHFVRYATKAREVYYARVGARPRNDELRAALFRKPLHFVIVYRFQFAVNAV